MIEERKKEDVVKCINGELYYLGDYANFLYEKLDEKDKENERLNNIIKDFDNWIDEQIDIFMETSSKDYVSAVYTVVECKLAELKEKYSIENERLFVK